MNFTGQVRVPEIDHPGVPATILVEDDQIEVFLEGESLGRWSLFDVEASRLVSSAFSLSLAGEEITFLADEPVDFAYKAVDHMAEAWARYKSMALPRRVVAVGRSRRGTLPSRIGELRAAMLQNLEVAGRGVPRLVPVETLRQIAPELDEQIPAPSSTIAPTPPEPLAPVEEEVAEPPRTAASLFRPSPVDEAVAAAAVESFSPPVRPRLRPGPGVVARRPPTTGEPTMPAEPSTSSPESPAPVLRSPWDEPVPPVEPISAFVPEPSVSESPVAETASVEPSEPAPVPIPTPGEIEEIEESVAEELTPTAASEMREMVKELLSTSSDEGGEEGARDLVVDLGAYEGRSPGSGHRDQPSPASPPKDPVMASASVAPAERSGLMGAVRSAFARNKVTHEHQFVEAPGGIGIVRQICAECGYISIGLSD